MPPAPSPPLQRLPRCLVYCAPAPSPWHITQGSGCHLAPCLVKAFPVHPNQWVTPRPSPSETDATWDLALFEVLFGLPQAPHELEWKILELQPQSPCQIHGVEDVVSEVSPRTASGHNKSIAQKFGQRAQILKLGCAAHSCPWMALLSPLPRGSPQVNTNPLLRTAADACSDARTRCIFLSCALGGAAISAQA